MEPMYALTLTETYYGGAETITGTWTSGQPQTASQIRDIFSRLEDEGYEPKVELHGIQIMTHTDGHGETHKMRYEYTEV